MNLVHVLVKQIEVSQSVATAVSASVCADTQSQKHKWQVGAALVGSHDPAGLQVGRRG